MGKLRASIGGNAYILDNDAVDPAKSFDVVEITRGKNRGIYVTDFSGSAANIETDDVYLVTRQIGENSNLFEIEYVDDINTKKAVFRKSNEGLAPYNKNIDKVDDKIYFTENPEEILGKPPLDERENF